jgi:hypothetical protein
MTLRLTRVVEARRTEKTIEIGSAGEAAKSRERSHIPLVGHEGQSLDRNPPDGSGNR